MEGLDVEHMLAGGIYMRILGIDPGLAIIGYAIIDKEGNSLLPRDYGCIRTPAGLPIAERLLTIYRDTGFLVEKWQPDFMAVEQLFFNRNVTNAFSVGQARGVCLLAAAQSQCPVAEYTPLQVKQAVVGNGRAAKQQVAVMVKALLNLKEIPKPDDVTDALAVAICHCNRPVTLALRRG
jgi:crossover junction endodeoxyribonuclease RuvC